MVQYASYILLIGELFDKQDVISIICKLVLWIRSDFILEETVWKPHSSGLSSAMTTSSLIYRPRRLPGNETRPAIAWRSLYWSRKTLFSINDQPLKSFWGCITMAAWQRYAFRITGPFWGVEFPRNNAQFRCLLCWWLNNFRPDAHVTSVWHQCKKTHVSKNN